MKHFILTLVVVLLLPMSSWAFYMGWDFADSSTGTTLYYNYYSPNKSIAMVVQYDHDYYKGDIVIPEYVVHGTDTITIIGINNEAFYRCPELTSITIPNSVTTIGSWAFYGCTGLTEITIPNSVTTIGSDIFRDCTNLAKVTLSNSLTSLSSYLFLNCYALTSVDIPNSVTTIEGRAFANCTGLTSVTIPDSVTTIGDGAFSCCTGLTSLTLGNSVTTIGKYAFDNCSALTSIDIPNSMTSIGRGAFRYCTNLTGEITIPESVTSIGYVAFKETSLTKVNYNAISADTDSDSDWEYLVFPNTISEINIGYGVTKLSYGIFSGTSPKQVTIPPTVTTIEHYAFRDCSNLELITIPCSVTSIDFGAFNCHNLKNVYSFNESPPKCGTYGNNKLYYVFYGVDKDTCVLHVPTDSSNTYARVSQWQDFLNIVGENFNTDLYLELWEDIYSKQSLLSDVWNTIIKEYPDVSDDFKEDYNALKDELANLISLLEEWYRNCSLGDKLAGDIRDQLEEIKQKIEKLLDDAKEEYALDVKDITIPKTREIVGYYTINGMKITAPQKGINIIRYSDGTTKKVLVK